MRPTKAHLTPARKICRHYLNELEKGVDFDAKHLHGQAGRLSVCLW
jgi:hypothetical protein